MINIFYLHNKSSISGGERSLLNLWENLDRSEFNVFVMIPEEGDFSKEIDKLDIEILFFNTPKISVINISKIFHWFKEIHNFIKDKNINIIHSYTPRNNILGALLSKYCRIPIIWHERNLICDLTIQNEKDLSKQFAFLANSIVCNSNAVAKRFKNRNNVKVIHNGVNLKRFFIQKDAIKKKRRMSFNLNEKIIIGTTTNFSTRKRIDYIIDIAENLSKIQDNIFFIIVGDEFEEENSGKLNKLKQRVKNKNIKDKVLFTGFQRDINSWLNTFDIFIHMALAEACSRSILEAMACGLPVIAVNDGGNPELIRDKENGFLVDKFDMDDVIKHIKILCDDKNVRKEFGINSRLRIEKEFNVKSNVLNTQKLYKELILCE